MTCRKKSFVTVNPMRLCTLVLRLVEQKSLINSNTKLQVNHSSVTTIFDYLPGYRPAPGSEEQHALTFPGDNEIFNFLVEVLQHDVFLCI